MIIGCVTLVPVGNLWPKNVSRVAAIHCAKGRGITLPGGKWEKGELFEETAEREFFEETGQKLSGLPKLIFQGYTLLDNYTYCFLGECLGYSANVVTAEGETRWAQWDDLLRSDFKAYYSVLRQHLVSLGFYTGE